MAEAASRRLQHRSAEAVWKEAVSGRQQQQQLWMGREEENVTKLTQISTGGFMTTGQSLLLVLHWSGSQQWASLCMRVSVLIPRASGNFLCMLLRQAVNEHSVGSDSAGLSHSFPQKDELKKANACEKLENCTPLKNKG